MGDLLLVVKGFFLAAMTVILLQVKIGDQTLEQQSYNFFVKSQIGITIQEVAQGGVYVITQAVRALSSSVTNEFAEKVDKSTRPGFRTMKLQMERSQKFLDEEARRLKASAEEAIEEKIQR